MTIAFTTLGRPRPQGSKRAIPSKNGVVLVESSGALPAYRQALAHDARQALQALTGAERLLLHHAPVYVTVTFYFQRPQTHMRTGRFAGTLRASAPAWPTSRQLGDCDKHCRALFDSLVTGGVLRDDSQVVGVKARKRYAGPGKPECTVVEVRVLAATVEQAETEAIAA